MLIAALNEERIEAENAERGLTYVCPECRDGVFLKRGRIKMAHFAHRSPTSCAWAVGETLAHLQAKKLFRDCFTSRGLQSEVEFVVPSLPKNRRADVMVWSPRGKQFAFELQHSNIGIPEIECRAFSYAGAGIAQMWLPFLRPEVWDQAEICTIGMRQRFLIPRYPARPFERFIHTLHGELWFYNPEGRAIWRGYFDKQSTWEEERSWTSEYEEEKSAGGSSYTSRRWKELTLSGPYSLDQLKIDIAPRWEYRTKRYNVPGGRVARFVLAAEEGNPP